jgi:hypothetical protein
MMSQAVRKLQQPDHSAAVQFVFAEPKIMPKDF